MAIAKIAGMDDWIDLFKVWQDDIGLHAKELKEYKFDVKLGELEVDEVAVTHEPEGDVSFLWVIGQKPGSVAER